MAERKTATKLADKQATPAKKPQALTLRAKAGDDMPMTKAKATTRASINSALVVNAYQTNIMGDVDLDGLVANMQVNFKAVSDGDMSTMEAMLVGQATALQTMFTSLAMRAASQEYLNQYQTYMALALKAQAQSRATISALVDLKYPRQATFVKQANISNGHQQVNNGTSSHQKLEGSVLPGASNYAHAEDFQTEPNKLLDKVSV
jgi:hypothetical protein